MKTFLLYLLLFLIGGLSIVFPNLFLNPLQYQNVSITHFEFWRLWTAHLVHINWMHLILNLAALFLIQNLFRLKSFTLLKIGIITLPLISIFTYTFYPELSWFNGLSGFNHALLACLLCYEILSKRNFKLIIPFTLLGLKLVFETKDSFISNRLEFPIAITVHQMGVLVGVILTVTYLIAYLLKLQLNSIKDNQIKSLQV